MAVNNGFTIQALMQVVASMQESINNLTRQVNDNKRYEIAGAPRMDLKDQKDPAEFNGQHFAAWSEDFVTHLRIRDRRWEPLLKASRSAPGSQ